MRQLILVVQALTMFVAAAHASDIPTTGRADPNLASFDRVMVKFIQENKLPGASLAIGRGGKLVYARGFGFADIAAKESVKPDSLFRIASISKSVTATAVMMLVQDRRLKLDDRAFSLLNVAPHLVPDMKPDPRIADITILQLLQHTAGWDRGKSFDPMFRSVQFAEALGVAPPAEPEHVIRYMLGQPLDFTPGERYAYSNFGYCVLGRIIEHVTKQTYEDYVKNAVLKPLGISTMQIGRTRFQDRTKNEVRYYGKSDATGPSVFAADLGQQVPHAYGTWYLEAMDAHGGWIASAPDLVTFGMQFDAPPTRRLLNDPTLKLMFKRPEDRAGHDESGSPTDFYYACGWLVRPVPNTSQYNIWHNGSLPGTSTLLVRRHDDLCWAVLFNSRETDPAPSSQLDPLLHAAAKEVTRWPQ